MPRRTAPAGPKAIVGANLRAKREALGLDQGQAADLAGVPQAMLSRWERGRRLPEVTALAALAATYHCPIDDFLGGMDERYDEVIESRLPINSERFYAAKVDTFIARTTAAMKLALEPGAPSPTPARPAAARVAAAGKSKSTRARRERKRKTPRRGK